MSYFGNTHLKQIITILQDRICPIKIFIIMKIILKNQKIKQFILSSLNYRNWRVIRNLITSCCTVKSSPIYLIARSKILIYIQVGVLKLLLHSFTLIFFSLTYSFFLTNLFNGNFTDPITWIAGVLINDPTIKSEDQDSNQEYYRIPTIEAVASIFTDFNTDPFPDNPQDKPVYIFALTEIASLLSPSFKISPVSSSTEAVALAPAPTAPVEDLNVTTEEMDSQTLAFNLVHTSFMEFSLHLQQQFHATLPTPEQLRTLSFAYWSSEESVPSTIVGLYTHEVIHINNLKDSDLTENGKTILCHLATALAIIDLSNTPGGRYKELKNNSEFYFTSLETLINN